jgi:hypothetical protein
MRIAKAKLLSVGAKSLMIHLDSANAGNGSG